MAGSECCWPDTGGSVKECEGEARGRDSAAAGGRFAAGRGEGLSAAAFGYSEDLRRRLGIRYVQLIFELEMLEDGRLPTYKSSALRGGMGEMLLNAYCFRNRQCERCGFEDECTVRRIMYAKYPERPESVTSGESIGYQILCEDYREMVHEGDALTFTMTLFGRLIVYLNPILQAFSMLGMTGLGKQAVHFRIRRVMNTRRQVLAEDNWVYQERYRVETLADYVDYRIGKMRGGEYWKGGGRRASGLAPAEAGADRGCDVSPAGRLAADSDRGCDEGAVGRLAADSDRGCDEGAVGRPAAGGAGLRLRLTTPVALKHNGEILKHLDLEVLTDALVRRIYMLDMFEGIAGCEARDFEAPKGRVVKEVPTIIPRYSSTHDRKINLSGVRGEFQLFDIDAEALAVLLAGEVIHAGKNISMGFGAMYLKKG